MSETDLPQLDFSTMQPYPIWERARTECPVIHSHGSDLDPRDGYTVTRFGDAEHTLRDWETFSSSINADHIGKFMGDLILAMNGPEHRQYRNLVAHAFRASALERWDADLVVPLIHGLIDDIAPKGQADLVADVTSKYPVQVICRIVGVPLEDTPQFHQWAEEINLGVLDEPKGMAASRNMRAYLEPIVEDRRKNPQDDLITDLVTAEIDGEKLTDEKIYGFLRLLLPAGAETTFRTMGNALTALLTRPDELARVTADRSLIPEVIEETLRWESSVTTTSRIATTDAEIAGVAIPGGCPVTVVIGSANHDAGRYDDGEEWKLGRKTQTHLAFGTGPHQCLGMHLARLELRTGLNVILDRLPNLRLDPSRPAPVIEGFAFRGPTTLPVLFDV
ncbi:MAG: hypothetical protein JWL73_180 [Actinomycetia bacterium]|nr:hypothetical protein [Actinomycetes bacterium]